MAFAVDASVTLHDGTVVTHHVDGADGESREAVEARAQQGLGQLIANDARYDGREVIDLGARVEFVTDDLSTPTPRDFVRSLPAGNLVMNAGVRLFGAPPVGAGANGSAATGRMWVPVQNTTVGGTTYTVYQEATYLNASGAEAGGRMVRVPHGGGDAQILINGEWQRLSNYTGSGGSNPTPGGNVPNSQLPPVSDAGLVSVPTSPAVPGGIVETDGDDHYFVYNLTPSFQQNVAGRVYDVYTAPGPNGPTTWRRLHSGSARPWEVRGNGGTWTENRFIVTPDVADVVRSAPAGWTIMSGNGVTYFSETAGARRSVRINNATGAVEIGTGGGNYRAATADDHLPAFVSFPPGPQSATLRIGGRNATLDSLTGSNRFMTEGSGASAVRYEVMVPHGEERPTSFYRRRVDASGRPLADAGWQRAVQGPNNTVTWENVTVAAAPPPRSPRVVTGGAGHPSRRASGGDIL